MSVIKSLFAMGLALALAPLAARAQAAPKDYHGVGVVDDIEKGGKLLVIEHEDIPGLMKAMTMAFEVSDVRLSKGVHVGDRIRFTLARRGRRTPIVAIQKLKAGGASPKAAPTAAPTTDMKGMNM